MVGFDFVSLFQLGYGELEKIDGSELTKGDGGFTRDGLLSDIMGTREVE